MAVNVNTVYQRVLTIANKEQRGYITPQEFNILANQAQMDLFEQYFYDINQFNRVPGNSTEYSDMLSLLEEKIAAFRVNNASLTASTSRFEDSFETDITGWTIVNSTNGTVTHEAPAASNSYNGGLKILQNANGGTIGATSSTFTLTAGKKYRIEWSVIAKDEPVDYKVTINGPTNEDVVYQDFEPELENISFTFLGDTTGNHSITITNNDIGNQSDFITIGYVKVYEIDDTTLPGDLYRLGEVYYKASGASYPTTVAHVNANEATLFNLSPLARPTTSNPAYVRDSATSIKIYPETLGTGSTVTCNYIKTPTDVVWGYNTVAGTAVYNSSSSTNFDMHESEEVNLVNRILVLAGILMKDATLPNLAAQEEVKDIQQEKS